MRDYVELFLSLGSINNCYHCLVAISSDLLELFAKMDDMSFVQSDKTIYIGKDIA